MKTTLRISLLGSLLILAPLAAYGQHDAHHDGAQHGRVDFATSCEPAAQERLGTGLALLHHMMYEQAEAEFVAVSEADDACAMAHWGIAMSVIHPLWGERPSDAAFEKGQAALERARALNPSTEREAAYLAATQLFFRDWADTSYPDQLAAFEAGYHALHEAYPEDVDAAAFDALGHLATAPKADQTLAHQRTAGALLEDLLTRAPDHPGLFHYTIHAYDNPALADRALTVARDYDDLAPDVPHALHMPSHIFIRLGHWPDAIDWNTRSAAAALRQPVGGMTSMHYAHALDYLAYARLQQGRDGEAHTVLDDVMAVTDFQPTFATAYAIAAVPARLVLERGRWAEAAALPVRTHGAFPWDRFPGAEAITHFARGLGAARSDDPDAAREAVAALDALHARMTESGETYWAVLADAQRKAVNAWLAYGEGDEARALNLMREAADLEDSVDKHPVTPGAVLPARELLGDMLLLMERPEEALAAYDAALRISPNRLNSLYGAARAAESTGDSARARTYYTQLVEQTTGAEEALPALSAAKRFMGSD